MGERTYGGLTTAQIRSALEYFRLGGPQQAGDLIGCIPDLIDALEAAERREAQMREALAPFVKLFDANRERHMKRSAEAVKLGRVWFDEMPDDWIFETKGLTMGDFRRACKALEPHP